MLLRTAAKIGGGVVAAGALAGAAESTLRWPEVVDHALTAFLAFLGTAIMLYYKNKEDERRAERDRAERAASVAAIRGDVHRNTQVTERAEQKAEVAAVKADEAAKIVTDGIRGTVQDTNATVHNIDRKVPE